MIEILEKLHEEVTGRLGHCASEQDVEQIRVDYLGRKGGKLTALLRGLRELPAEERPSAGAELNRRRGEVETLLETRLAELRRQRGEHARGCAPARRDLAGQPPGAWPGPPLDPGDG